LRDPLVATRNFAKKKDRFSISKKKQGLQHIFSWCFPTLEGSAASVVAANAICRGMATDIFNQRTGYLDHWKWNHKSVYETALAPNPYFAKAKILAIRTESLWEDWMTANQYLGQSKVAIPANATRIRPYGHLKLHIPTYLSEAGRRHLPVC